VSTQNIISRVGPDARPNSNSRKPVEKFFGKAFCFSDKTIPKHLALTKLINKEYMSSLKRIWTLKSKEATSNDGPQESKLGLYASLTDLTDFDEHDHTGSNKNKTPHTWDHPFRSQSNREETTRQTFVCESQKTPQIRANLERYNSGLSLGENFDDYKRVLQQYNNHENGKSGSSHKSGLQKYNMSNFSEEPIGKSDKTYTQVHLFERVDSLEVNNLDPPGEQSVCGLSPELPSSRLKSFIGYETSQLGSSRRNSKSLSKIPKSKWGRSSDISETKLAQYPNSNNTIGISAISLGGTKDGAPNNKSHTSRDSTYDMRLLFAKSLDDENQLNASIGQMPEIKLFSGLDLEGSPNNSGILKKDSELDGQSFSKGISGKEEILMQRDKLLGNCDDDREKRATEDSANKVASRIKIKKKRRGIKKKVSNEIIVNFNFCSHKTDGECGHKYGSDTKIEPPKPDAAKGEEGEYFMKQKLGTGSIKNTHAESRPENLWIIKKMDPIEPAPESPEPKNENSFMQNKLKSSVVSETSPQTPRMPDLGPRQLADSLKLTNLPLEGTKGGVQILTSMETFESGQGVESPGKVFRESPRKGNRKETPGFGVVSKKSPKIWSVQNSQKISKTLQEETRKDLLFSFAHLPEEIGSLQKVPEESPDGDMDLVSPPFVGEAKRKTNAHLSEKGDNRTPDTGFLQYGTFFDPEAS
jgi:hypothetical protein